ncbi:DUF3224 domain-containing protein [Streptomyces sp. 15-116A]|uniref:DUF3224 domain-containing protein n=1 Tax=Streptomyces sp. 15-116A TaxID=2259035 RepID=UPI0021B36100|nr:DUF3224 domain-containing protein [Streptomyces sp. 15-116A]MCT7351352.1 DUF3224 domain-containing protein [Streptomyces sp. 15-116A]
MRASGTFKVVDFTPAPVPGSSIETALSVGVATMEKQYDGEITGRSATLFTSAFDEPTGTGTYVAMESFEGTLHDRTGTFNYAHTATMSGGTRQGDFHVVIVPGSGTGKLTGITGTGGMAIDEDGTHRIWFDYDLDQRGTSSEEHEGRDRTYG